MHVWATTPPTPNPSGGAPGGGGGAGIDPGGIISQLPDGTGPVATVIVVFLLFLASLVPVAAKFIPDRPAKTTATSPQSGGTPGPALTRADADQLQTSYDRLDTDLKEAKASLREATAEIAAIRVKYEAAQERNHDLEMELAGANQKLDVAEDRLRRMEAQLAVVLQQGRPRVVPPPPLPVLGPVTAPGTRGPRRRDPLTADPGLTLQPAPDEAPTDPIRGARR